MGSGQLWHQNSHSEEEGTRREAYLLLKDHLHLSFHLLKLGFVKGPFFCHFCLWALTENGCETDVSTCASPHVRVLAPNIECDSLDLLEHRMILSNAHAHQFLRSIPFIEYGLSVFLQFLHMRPNEHLS